MSEKYYIINDMKKYFPNFNIEEYDDKTKEELISICRQYCREHLPINVTTWLLVNEPDEKLLYRKGCERQILFIRDTIMKNLFLYKEYPQIKDDLYNKDNLYNIDARKIFNDFQPMVISTHYSKSVLLPVMEINLKSVGVKFVLRNNFYNWNVSVESQDEINCDFKETFTDENYHYCFCEGFPKDRIYGKYKENHNKFTCCITNDYVLFTFMWLLRDYLYK